MCDEAKQRELEEKLAREKERADKAESNARVLRDRVAAAEVAVNEAQRELHGARVSAGRWESRARKAEAKLAGVPVEEYEADEDSFRDELRAHLLKLLATEAPPQWLLDRVDRLAGLK